MREMVTSLREIEHWLERYLQEEFPTIEPVRIHCALQEDIFVISVHVIESTALSPSIVLPLVQKKVMNGGILPHYPLETYFIVHGKDRFDAPDNAALVPFLSTLPVLAGKRRFSLPNRAIALGIGFCVALGFLYALTRPCSWGSCPEIDRARQWTERAVINPDPIAARNDLSRSLSLLSAIPPWSSYRDRALTLKTEYQAEADDLDRLLAMIHSAETLTGEKAIAPDRLDAIRRRWRGIISRLETFPPDSPFYPLARREMTKYRGELAVIEKRIDRERAARFALENARKTAKLATEREKTARTPSAREAVEKTWEAALKHLRTIPADTGASQVARTLEETYRARWTAARGERDTLELLEKGGDLARKAEKAARENNWTQSVAYWRQSLDILQRVPGDSPEYRRAATSIALYRKALEQAIDRERIYQDLQQICDKKANICSYEVGDDRIRVYLSDRYAERVQATAQQAQERSDTRIQVDLLNHLARFESALQTISDGAARPVEVYNADRVLLSLYEPKR